MKIYAKSKKLMILSFLEVIYPSSVKESKFTYIVIINNFFFVSVGIWNVFD